MRLASQEKNSGKHCIFLFCCLLRSVSEEKQLGKTERVPRGGRVDKAVLVVSSEYVAT